MIQLSNLSATPTALASANPAKPLPTHQGKTVKNVQSKQGFQRTVKHSKNLITLESSAGGSVAIPISELWTLCEAHDSKLCIPKPVDAMGKTP